MWNQEKLMEESGYKEVKTFVSHCTLGLLETYPAVPVLC